MNRRAFTLVEMLLAVALLGMIASLLFFSLNQVSVATSSALGKSMHAQGIRVVVDQMGRELQQSVPGVSTNSDAFIADPSPPGSLPRAAALHFVATIDNSTGFEEAEVHYFYDGTNTLWKSIVYGGSSAWDFASRPDWDQTPAVVPLDQAKYSPMLEGVRSMAFELFDEMGGTNSFWIGRGGSTPTHARVILVTFEPPVLRRWGSADKVPAHLLSLARTNAFIVALPRRE